MSFCILIKTHICREHITNENNEYSHDIKPILSKKTQEIKPEIRYKTLKYIRPFVTKKKWKPTI